MPGTRPRYHVQFIRFEQLRGIQQREFAGIRAFRRRSISDIPRRRRLPESTGEDLISAVWHRFDTTSYMPGTRPRYRLRFIRFEQL